ncbi:phage tail assembly protein [Yersinia enterocolitica]|uniref:phage tail assembly protein n=1 Tax=Yersinia enterocolitica TaxID=630 RepID=UPI000E08CCE3|nr:phage tail assembly protein [Yersinia enterocolitica]SUP66723.1 Tail protein [Yersinia enterocolitica]
MKEVKAKNETNAVIDTVAPEQDKFNVITLDVPIVRGGNTITEVTVNKPTAGALRGAKLQALLDTDVDALIRVLPRITTPNLTVPEISNLDPADIYALSQALAIFFLPNSVKSDYLSA